MKKKLIISLFSLFAVARMHGEVNPPTNHVCYFPSVTVTNHIDSPTIGAWVSAGGPYVLTGTNFVDVAIAGGVEAITNGEHKIVTTFEPCECGETNAPYSSFYPVAPDTYTNAWSCASTNDSGPGASFSETVTISEPGTKTLSAKFDGYRLDCSECNCSASASTNFMVYKLTVECDPWLGLDRRDAGEGDVGVTNKIGNGTATLDPSAEVSYDWSDGGVCTLTNQVDNKIEYWTMDKETCSGKYLDEKLTVTVTGEDPDFSGSATTNFTVVKVDVTLDGVGEEEEEVIGALFEYISDYMPDENTTTTIWTAEGTNELKSVSITCTPNNLPTQEMVTVSAPSGYLFQKIGVDEYIPAKSSYLACEISTNEFYFHAHATSGSLRDGAIEVAHDASGAKDKVKYTVFDLLRNNFDVNEKDILAFNISMDEKGGLLSGLLVKPDPYPLKAKWIVAGIPEAGTEYTWTASLAYLGKPEVGIGVAQDIVLKYVDNADSDDLLPPDGRWFGPKEIVVIIGDLLEIKRPITSCYSAQFDSKSLNGDEVSAWYYYYITDSAVPGLSDFTYAESLGNDTVNAGVDEAGELYIARVAIFNGASRPRIIDGQFWSTYYINYFGIGCHGIAKLCEHERWHLRLRDELTYDIFYPVIGPPVKSVNNDEDGDGMCDAREDDFGSDPLDNDTYGMNNIPEFSDYVSYADNEIFCRFKQNDELGIETHDWYLLGPQLKRILDGEMQ